MIFLSQKSSSQNGVKIQLQETSFVNGKNFQEFKEWKNQSKKLLKEEM